MENGRTFASGSHARIWASGNTVYVRRDMNRPLDMEFDIACRKLLDCPSGELVVDMSGVRSAAAQYLHALASVAREAGKSGRTLVVRAGGELASAIRPMDEEKLFKLEVTGA